MKNLKIIILSNVIILVILIRLALPYALLRYAEYRINKIPDYHVSISDVDVHFIQGGYVIKDIKLEKNSQKIPVPFFTAHSIKFAVDWPSLLHGLFVSEIQIDQPVLNFVTDPQGKNEQLSIHKEWQSAAKALFPLKYNKIFVHDGIIHYRSYSSQPPFDLYLKNIEASMIAYESVTDPLKKLPGSFKLEALTMDGAKAYLDMRFDPMAEQPTFDLNAKLENMNVKETNNFLKHYTKVTVKRGKFSLYVEAAAAKGKIIGYAKPILKNLEVADSPSKNPVEAIAKGITKVAAKVLENPKTKTVATKINISGDIEDPDTSLWSIVFNMLSHAFLQALLPQIDHSINFETAK